MMNVLSFDIERAGPTDQYRTLAIGACVVDAKGRILDRLLATNYRPASTRFDPGTWANFWSKHPAVLARLEYRGPLSVAAQEVSMIEQFQQFRRTWEAKGALQLVSDNLAFDVGFLNRLIERHTDDLPLPYAATKQPARWLKILETSSMGNGMCKLLLPTWTRPYGHVRALLKHFNKGEAAVVNSHVPDEDSLKVALDYLALESIARAVTVSAQSNQGRSN